MQSPGRDRPVLVLAEDEGVGRLLAAELGGAGYVADVVRGLDAFLAYGSDRAQAVLVAGVASPAGLIRALRDLPICGPTPLVCFGVPRCQVAELLAAGADEVVAQGAEPGELALRLANVLRLRKLTDREQLGRTELAALLDIAQAATSVLDVDALMKLVVQRIAQVVQVERCSAILVDGTHGHAVVVCSHDAPELSRLPIDLSRYPELQSALSSREPVVVDDIHRDPRMAAVRPLLQSLPISSLVVAPLVAAGNAYGALFLRLARDRAFGLEEQGFIRAAASAVANSVRNAQLHQSVRGKLEALEAAYLERYRELDRLNEQLREANRVKDELLAVCSHDLRAPLHVLLGHAQILLAGDGVRDGERKGVEVMHRQGLRVLQLVEQLLERGRGRSDGLGLTLRPVDVAACAREVASDLSVLAAERQIELRALPAVGELTASADASGLRQVLENLVGNAIAHTTAGTLVEVEVCRDEPMLAPSPGLDPGFGGRIRVEVRDRGTGIPPAELPLVFERYRSSGSGAGLGLGLAICRELVELHGGDIWAQNRVGGGVTFTFTLPSGGGQQAGPAPGLPHLLVVEDEADQRAILGELLAGRFTISFARSGPEGLARARLLQPQAVILDVFLGAMDGLDVARQLRARPGLSELPILFMSASREAEAKVRELGLGGLWFFRKPLDGRALLARLDELTRRS